MLPSIRAIAVDYDGTIAEHDRVDVGVLDVLASIRASGVRLVLATGRIVDELVAVFPDVTSRFDAIVAENGGVIVLPDGRRRALVPPVSPALIAELEERSIPFRRGSVLLATDARHAHAVVEAIGRLGLDEQILRNRDALMVLPARVSKASGIDEAFAELGVSHHSAIGIGDAENDHALLSACEIGVAVGNAVDALKARADIVIEKPGPAGLRDWLQGVHAGTIAVTSRRRVALGVRPDGTPALIPSSMCNVLVVGQSGSGKSYLAGLFAERLVRAGYSICMLDPEGDYARLGELHGVLTVGGSHRPPSSDELTPLVRHKLGSVVVDLSLLTPADRIDYTRHALAWLMACRAASGFPHWIFVDEAHASLADDAPFADLFRQKGICLVTYHPSDLGRRACDASDIGLFLTGSDAFASAVTTSKNAGRANEIASEIQRLEPRSALLVDLRNSSLSSERFAVDTRVSSHVRHRHKYAYGSLSSGLCFEFRDDKGRVLGRMACNVAELEKEIAIAPLGSIAHHTRSGDFSRWAGEALQDHVLAANLKKVETEPTGDVEQTRHALLLAIHDRYTASALAS